MTRIARESEKKLKHEDLGRYLVKNKETIEFGPLMVLSVISKVNYFRYRVAALLIGLSFTLLALIAIETIILMKLIEDSLWLIPSVVTFCLGASFPFLSERLSKLAVYTCLRLFPDTAATERSQYGNIQSRE